MHLGMPAATYYLKEPLIIIWLFCIHSPDELLCCNQDLLCISYSFELLNVRQRYFLLAEKVFVDRIIAQVFATREIPRKSLVEDVSFG